MRHNWKSLSHIIIQDTFFTASRSKPGQYLGGLFLLCVLTLCASSLYAENACVFQLSNGTAHYLKKDTAKLVLIGADPVEIVIGDRLISGPETRGNLSFPDGSVFRLKSNTTLELINEGVKLTVGEAMFQLQKQGRDFQVVTPSSVCGVLGTIFDVNVDGNGKSRVRVFEGIVDVRSREDQKRQTLLRAGQMIESRKFQPLPEAPKSFDAGKIIKEDPQFFQRNSGQTPVQGGAATRNPQFCTQNQQPNVQPQQPQGQGNPLFNNVPGNAPGNVPANDPRNPMLDNPRQGQNAGTRDPGTCAPGQTTNPLLCGNGQTLQMPRSNPQGTPSTVDARLCGTPQQPGAMQNRNDPRSPQGSQNAQPVTDNTRDKRQCQSFETTNPMVCQSGNPKPAQDNNQRQTLDPRACMNQGPGQMPQQQPQQQPQNTNTSNPLQCRQDQNRAPGQPPNQPGGQTNPGQMQSKPLMTQDPRLCNSVPTKDPKLCQGSATSNPMSCRQTTRNAQECQIQQTQDPRTCQPAGGPKPQPGQPANNPPAGNPQPDGSPNPGQNSRPGSPPQPGTAPQPAGTPNQPNNSPPETRDPRNCPNNQTQDPRLCQSPQPKPGPAPQPEPTQPPNPTQTPTPTPTPTPTDPIRK